LALPGRACLAGALALAVAACGGGGGGSVVPRPPATLNITTTTLADGVNGAAYSVTVQATGGTGARTWTVATGALPDGLDLDGATGAISGTPTAAGTFNFTVQAQDSGSPSQTDTQALSIRVADPLQITTPTLPNGADGNPYDQVITASGGIAPFSWSASGMPGGLSLSGSTTVNEALSGLAIEGGSFNTTIQVQDSGSPSQSVSKDYPILILQITTFELPNAVQNQPYGSVAFEVTAQIDPTTWSESFTDLFEPDIGIGLGKVGTPCEGLQIDFGAGTISGTPSLAGLCGPFTLGVEDSDSPPRSTGRTLTVLVIQELQVTTPSLPNATTGQAYGQTLGATGGVPAYDWSEPTAFFDDVDGFGAAATPCEGLRLNFSTGNISGTPVNVGACGPFTAQVTDSGVPQQSDQRDFTITVTAGPLVITTAALPGGAVNRTYLGEIEASGGTLPFTWSEPTTSFDPVTGAGAAVPCQGLTLNLTATGGSTTITGTPANQGTCGPFTVQVNDSAADSDSGSFSIVVDPEPVGVGRNDTVVTATDFTPAGGNPTLGDRIITASISPYGPTSVDAPNPADNDFYKFTAQEGAEVRVTVTARGLATFSGLDPVVEIVIDDGSALGFLIVGACSSAAPPPLFNESCLNDDIELGINRDSRLTYKVQSGKTTFFVRVLDWRGDARPDFIYELRVTNAD